MRITITASGRRHGITGAEIRAVIEYPAVRQRLRPRLPGTVPVLFIGSRTTDEPDIEVIADLVDPDEAIVFHAMMLRPSLVAALALDRYITPNYTSQRSGKERPS